MSEVSTYPRITMLPAPVPLPTREAAAQLLDAIAAACRVASAAAGFGAITVHRRSADDLRVVALDASGRALVSQVSVDATHQAHLTTEVLGVRDGSCHEILDRFDGAMEIAGIRSAARQRSVTGGVCATAAARDYLRKGGAPLRPKPLAPAGEQEQGRTRAAVVRKRNSSQGR